MKKFKVLLVVLCAVACLFALTACGDTQSENKTTTAAEATTTASEATKSVLYKDIMIPFDQIVPTEHIVLLQNALNYGRDGFYTTETKPVTTEITYKDAKVQAYSMSYPINFLTYGFEGDITVTQADGSSATYKADDLKAAYVIIDFQSDAAPVIYNPESKTEIAAFAYLSTDKGEGIYSIPATTTHNTKDIVATCGWANEGQFRYVATDYFHIPVPVENNDIGELKGTLSGAINASFPTLTIASGKLNDVLYVEKIHDK